MKIKYLIYVALPLVALYVLSMTIDKDTIATSHSIQKMNGVNFVSPPQPFKSEELHSLKRINANWISIIPYAYTPENDPKVYFLNDHPRWWGEGINGSIEQIKMAKKEGFKVMVKPHVWVLHEGWPGEFKCETENEWLAWEESYSTYVLTLANACDSLDVDLFCIGTEYRHAVKLRPKFWKKLVSKVREVYHGPLTYAANWDNYENVLFWDDLDFIGIDAYFPLSEEKSPDVDELKELWSKYIDDLDAFSKNQNKKVIFTEYGYRSCDFATSTPWNISKSNNLNLKAQENAYEALFASVWQQDFIIGGFLWKWFVNDDSAGGATNNDFTPQNKPVEDVIKKFYSTAKH